MKEWITLSFSFIIFMGIGVSFAQLCLYTPERHTSIMVIR